MHNNIMFLLQQTQCIFELLLTGHLVFEVVGPSLRVRCKRTSLQTFGKLWKSLEVPSAANGASPLAAVFRLLLKREVVGSSPARGGT